LYAKGEDSMARYEHWHDFRKNHTQFGGYCTQKEEFEKEPETQEKSPGILMILEAEDATNLSSMEDAKASITATLKAAGMGVISISEDSFEKLGTLIFVLEEGYVTVRLWFEHKYVAFDVHLWSRFEMHERIKQALVTAVGSDSVSQYRIVAGGMFGISTWKEDEKNRGPKFTRPCVKEGGVSSLDTLGNVDEGAVKVLFAEALGLLDEGVVTAIAVCGTKLQSCLALDAMNELENVKTFPIYACVQSSVFSEMSACERKTFDMISALVDENGSKVGAIVLDDNAPKPMAQIIHSIFSKKAYRMRLLTTKLTVVTVLTNDAESWRVEFLERFRIFVPEPGYRTSIKFASSRSNIELGIVAAGNPMFFETIQSKIKKMEAKTGLTADLDSIEGSIFDLHKYTSPDYKAPNFFLPTDYNQTEALLQFLTQTPLGYQVVFQLEPGFDPAHVSKDKVVRPGDRIIVEWNDEEDYLATVIARNIDGTYRIEYDVGDIDDAMDRGEFTKLETQEERDASVHLSSATVEEAMMSALGMGGLSTKTSSVKMFAIGDGCIVVATFEGGNAVALWDGKVHVDLNVFTYNEDPGFVHAFEATFQNVVSPLSILLRDEQPRGIRHVVNFKRDIGDNDGPREQPHWALHLPALKLSES
jgi:S-adenosylmethionine/arginine decarboxylase-like enzyme